MVIVRKSVQATNSQIHIIEEGDDWVVPVFQGDEVVATASGAIAVGTLMEFDGETELIVTDARPTEEEAQKLWQGSLKGTIVVQDVLHEALLEWPTELVSVVEVWANDDSEPDRIWLVGERSGA